MKKLTILLIGILLCITSFAQTDLVVDPGFGTLNDAIAANKGDVIYKLKAGEWYGLSGIIENADFALTIIGEIPSDPTTMPAMIQIGSDGTGVPFSPMFNIFDDLTIKNVFIVDANENDVQPGGNLIRMQNSVKVVIDNVVIDPLNSSNSLVSTGSNENAKVFFTNSQIYRSGNQVHPNDGVLFQCSISGEQTQGWDTLYIENNTFVCTGTWLVANLGSNAIVQIDDFVWINHNTFIIHKSQLDIAWYENEYYLTNNLFFDFNTQPYNINWNIYYPDGSSKIGEPHSEMCLVNADTLEGETLPSSRVQFVEYNLWYLNPKIAEVPLWGLTHTKDNDGVTPLPKAYLMPLVWPKDSANVNREANMFYGNPDFPNFKYGNTLEIDPFLTQEEIYELSDSLAVWSLPSAQQHCWGFDPANLILPLVQWPKFWWNADDNGLGNPTAWPRFDGTYKNEAALKGSIEGLPLGDLNWYPDAKALWEENQDMIEAHILALNETQISIVGVESINSNIPTSYSLSQNYPNPFNLTTLIKFDVPQSELVTLKVYDLLGQEVAILVNEEVDAGYHQVTFNASDSDLTTGIYFYTLNAGGFTMSKKMILY